MSKKDVTVVMPGSGQSRQLDLSPGESVEQMLVNLGLDPGGYWVSAPGDSRLMSAGEEVFQVAESGSEFRVSPRLDAGA